jgi:hypothetical protein
LEKDATLFLLRRRRGLPVNVGYSSCEDKVKTRKEADFTANSSFFLNSHWEKAEGAVLSGKNNGSQEIQEYDRL